MDWTFDLVEERLVEAARLWRRSPDRDAGWLAVRAFWPDVLRHNHFGDYGDGEAVPRPLPLSRAQVRAMEEAGEWIGRFVDADDRRVVVLALAELARDRRPGWIAIRRALGMKLGAGAVARRYDRAICCICVGLNGQGKQVISRMMRDKAWLRGA